MRSSTSVRGLWMSSIKTLVSTLGISAIGAVTMLSLAYPMTAEARRHHRSHSRYVKSPYGKTVPYRPQLQVSQQRPGY